MRYIILIFLVLPFLSKASIVEFTLECEGRKGDIFIDVSDYGLVTELWRDGFDVGIRGHHSISGSDSIMYLFNNGDIVSHKSHAKQWSAIWNINNPKKIRRCRMINKKTIRPIELRKAPHHAMTIID